MISRGRLVAAVLAAVVVCLGLVVGTRMSAGADTVPRDTSPIVVGTDGTTTPTPSSSPTPEPAQTGGSIAPELRDDDDDDGPDDDDDSRDDDDDDGPDDDD